MQFCLALSARKLGQESQHWKLPSFLFEFHSFIKGEKTVVEHLILPGKRTLGERLSLSLAADEHNEFFR